MSWYEFKNESGDGAVTLRLLGFIGGEEPGSSLDEFLASYDRTARGRPLRVEIHSPGGSVLAAFAIADLLAQHPAPITTVNLGAALSAAAFIFAAGRDRLVARNSWTMIHRTWAPYLYGTADDLRKQAEVLDRMDQQLVDNYARITGQNAETVRRWLEEEKWMRAREALDLHFATGILDESNSALNLHPSWFALNIFRRPPEELKGTNMSADTPRTESLPAAVPPVVEPAGAATAPGAGAAPNNAADPAKQDRQSLLDALNRERERRLRLELQTLAATRGFDPESWIKPVLNDETVLEALRALPEMQSAGAPLPRARVENHGDPLIEKYQAMPPGEERARFRLEYFEHLRNNAPKLPVWKHFQHNPLIPMNANTFAAALVPDFVADAAVRVARTKLAMIEAFTRRFISDNDRPLARVQVPKVTSGSTTMTNPTNFENGDTTVDSVAVTINHLVNALHLSYRERLQGHDLQTLVEASAYNLARSINDTLTALMVSANFPSPLVIGAPENFDSMDLPPILAVTGAYPARNLTLSMTYLARLAPQNLMSFRLGQEGAFGFDRIYQNDRWQGAQPNTVGFVSAPDAIAIAAAMPPIPQQALISTSTLTLPNGLPVLTAVWWNVATRTEWFSIETTFGAAVADNGQGRILVSA